MLELMIATRFRVTGALWGAHTEHLTRNHFIIEIGLLQRGLPEYSLSGVMKTAISSFQGEQDIALLPTCRNVIFSALTLSALHNGFFPIWPTYHFVSIISGSFMKMCHRLTHSKEAIKTGQESFLQAKHSLMRASDVIRLSHAGLQSTKNFEVGKEIHAWGPALPLVNPRRHSWNESPPHRY